MIPRPVSTRSLLALVLLGATSVACATDLLHLEPPTAIDAAFVRLYNFDFAGAESILEKHERLCPSDPLIYSVRAASLLFAEMYRLQILQTEFFVDDENIGDDRKLKADPALREALFKALRQSREYAVAKLGTNPDDRDALLAMCMSQGVETDYVAFVERRRWRGLKMAGQANVYAQKLLAMRPPMYDAYHTVGMIEYVMGSVPFFVRWFVRFDQIRGSKQIGIQNLKLVAQYGRYYRPFAKVLLSVIYLREKQPKLAEELLAELAHDFPDNLLVKKELAKVRRMASRKTS